MVVARRRTGVNHKRVTWRRLAWAACAASFCWIAAARKGGTIVLTGLSRIDAQGSFPMFPFVMQEKRLIGSVYGSGNPPEDIARLVSLYQDGRLKLRELVTRTYALADVNQALDALAAGEGARGVIEL